MSTLIKFPRRALGFLFFPFSALPRTSGLNARSERREKVPTSFKKEMQRSALACATATCTLLVLDALWLFAGGSYTMFTRMASGMTTVRPWEGWQTALFTCAAYALLSLAICVLALPAKDPAVAAGKGALLGLTVYGVFDLTNLVLFGRRYGLELAAADVCWGTFVVGTSSLAGALAGSAA